MKSKRFSQEQIVWFLREARARGIEQDGAAAMTKRAPVGLVVSRRTAVTALAVARSMMHQRVHRGRQHLFLELTRGTGAAC